MPGQELTVRTLAYGALTAVRSEELPGLGFYLDAYERDPSVLDRAGKRDEDPTAFAFGQDMIISAVVLGAHFVLTALQNGVSEALQEWSKDTTSSALGKITAKLRKAPRRAVAEAVAPGRLDPEQVTALREAMLTIFRRRLNMPRKDAEMITDAVIGAAVSKLADTRP